VGVRCALVLAVSVVAALGLPGHARAGECGIPDARPFSADYAGHDAAIPRKPGLILAVSSGTDVPAEMRAAGAATVFFDLNFNKRVGTPSEPADPGTIVDRANRLFDYAVQVTGCDTPVVAENELFGAQTATPWSATNAQYRANVLNLLRQLAARGAHPYLTIANPPYTGGEAGDWWRQAAEVAVLVRQVYFTAPKPKGLYDSGPVRASRSMRQGMRGLVRHFTEIGIPASRVALELQFQSAIGQGGREGLQPSTAWFELVKLQQLAVRQVARELRIDSIWSWGWATFSGAGVDPDKAAAACVWLWARDPRLCDGPRAAGKGFDASLTAGRIAVLGGTVCEFPSGRISVRGIARLLPVVNDPDVATAVLFDRAILRARFPVTPHDAAVAERALIATRFGGSLGRYLAVVRGGRATRAIVRDALADELARQAIESGLRTSPPRAAAVDAFVRTYADAPVRVAAAVAAPPWLGIGGPAGAEPLGELPAPDASRVAAAALQRIAREEALAAWLGRREQQELGGAVCVGDRLPGGGPVDLAAFLPFLG